MAKAFTIRRAARSGCKCAIRYFGPDYLGTGTLWDLSQKGGRVAGSSAAKIGTSLILHIQLLEDLGEEWFWVDQAIVKWTEGKSFGVEFVTLTPQARDFLSYALGEFNEP